MTDENPVVAIDVRFISHPGIGRYITNLLEYLPSNITVVAIGNSDHRETALNARPETKWHEVSAETFSIREQLVLPILLHRLNIDIYHSPQFLLPVLWSGPTVVTLHDCAYDRYPSEFSGRSRVARWYYSAMMRHAVARADQIIAVSEQTADDIKRYYKSDGDSINVIHHGVSAGIVSTERPDSVPDEPYFLHVGTARPRKNLDRLLKAYADAVDRSQSLPDLVLAGEHNRKFVDITTRIAELGIVDRVAEIGYVDEAMLWQLYANATAFVFPSLYEGFGFPALEAMAVGTPVITSNQSALREVADGAAVLIDPEDTHAISDAMIRVATDSALREKLASDGQHRAVSFDWDKTATRTADIYCSIVNDYHNR